MRALPFMLGAALVMAGCASSDIPKANDVSDNEVHEMTRQEVINATQQCTDAGMRPQISYTVKKVGISYIEKPIDVTCSPKG